MTVTQIECFVETARTGNISRAAEKLFITQQSVSGQIKNLERELGFPLFIRKSKGVALTREGEFLFEDWEVLLSYLHLSIDKARDLFAARSNYIRIGLEDMGACSEDITEAFFQYEETFPELTIENRMMTPYEMLQQFEADKLDMAVLYQSEFDGQAGLHCIPLHQNNFRVCIFLAKNHPLAYKEDLTLSDLQAETLGMLNARYSLDYEKTQNLFFANAGAPVPKKKLECSSRRELEMALIAGRCVAVVYEPMFIDEEHKLFKKEVTSPLPSSRIALYWKEDHMETRARVLAGMIKEKLRCF